MRPAERLSLAIILGLAVLVCGTAGAGVYAWHQGGNMRFAVHENRTDGIDLAVTLPGALVNAVIALCPLPEDLSLDPRWEGMLPGLHEVADQLATMPDAVLVDVEDDGDRVRIAKVGRELVIRVLSREERVEIAIPITSVKRLVARLEARATA